MRVSGWFRILPGPVGDRSPTRPARSRRGGDLVRDLRGGERPARDREGARETIPRVTLPDFDYRATPPPKVRGRPFRDTRGIPEAAAGVRGGGGDLRAGKEPSASG